MKEFVGPILGVRVQYTVSLKYLISRLKLLLRWCKGYPCNTYFLYVNFSKA